MRLSLSYLSEQWLAFRKWQHTPYQVASMQDTEHQCPTCTTVYKGNYCPRCGQSARIGRYSFRTALLNFFDVWGLGNRSMFRTLRDLLLRPGYMIRDYLRGMQMAYFPPFKMFFLLTTLSILVSHGMNITGTNIFEEQRRKLEQMDSPVSITASDDATPEEKQMAEKASIESDQFAVETGYKFMRFQESYPNIFALCVLVFLSGFLYIFFRKSPAVPGMRYSEFLVALIYVANMYSIYSIVIDFFRLSDSVQMLALMLNIVPLKQLSGFSWWRTLLYFVLTGLLVVMTIASVGIAYGLYMIFKYGVPT